MTSLWPHSHGIRAAREGLSAGALTLAEVLGAAGYRAYAVQTNGWLHQSFGFHQGFERYVFPLGRGARGLPAASLWSHADRVVAEAERLIDAHPKQVPLFLYLHFMDVHQYAAPPEYRRFGTDGRGAYLAAIRWVDDAVARVRKLLDAVTAPGDHPHLEQAESELRQYFAGTLHKFTVPLVLAGTEFQRSVWQGLLQIPYGATCSYEQLARDVGRPKAQRAVGTANGNNRMAVIIPCHRVVGNDGRLCGYGGGLWRKQFLLEHERKSKQN